VVFFALKAETSLQGEKIVGVKGLDTLTSLSTDPPRPEVTPSGVEGIKFYWQDCGYSLILKSIDNIHFINI
jgi:hypothetical protein